ncbi:MAG: ABC transporter permease [Clostridia bacterium]|nr:ABC transporter permease [Clostridia bacterium]
MRTFVFAGRVTKEILRDPLSLVFGVGFPVVLLLLLSAIQSNIPVEMFRPEELTPGIAVFGLSFLSLFSAQLVSKDRSGAMLQRLFTTPMRAHHFILGYVLPLIPMALCQGLICYAVSLCLELSFTVNLIWAILCLLPVAGIYIGIGLLCGSLMTEKQATSICGALLTNLSAWLSGTWFSLELVGEGFRAFAELLPFSHAVDLGRAALSGDFSGIPVHLLWVAGYAAVLLTASVFAFRSNMKQ